jgi:hypothetical protein
MKGNKKLLTNNRTISIFNMFGTFNYDYAFRRSVWILSIPAECVLSRCKCFVNRAHGFNHNNNNLNDNKRKHTLNWNKRF